MKQLMYIVAVASTLSLTGSATAGIFNKCDKDSDVDCCSEPVCCPNDYRCECDVSTEPIEKSRYNVDAEPVCIPPITTSPFDCLRKKLCGKGRCDASDCCDNGSCDSCDGCSSPLGGLFSCFKKKSCCKIRCVNKLSKEKYECGEACVYEWSAVPKCGGCGNGTCCDSDSCVTVPNACCPTK